MEAQTWPALAKAPQTSEPVTTSRSASGSTMAGVLAAELHGAGDQVPAAGLGDLHARPPVEPVKLT